MAWRLDPDRGARAAVGHAAARQVDRVLRAVADGRDPIAHEPRRAIVRMRALLRLCRHALPATIRDPLDRRLRRVRRAIGPLRDREAAEELITGLGRGAAAERAPREVIATMRAAARRDRFRARAEARPALVELVATLLELRPRLRRLPIAGGWSAVIAGVGDAAHRAARAFTRVEAGADAETFHLWRRRVKDLLQQLRLFAEIGGGVGLATERTERLAAALGEEHDLAALADQVATGWAGLDARRRRRVLAAIAHRRARLRREALALGRLVHGHRPERIVDLIRGRWPPKRCVPAG